MHHCGHCAIITLVWQPVATQEGQGHTVPQEVPTSHPHRMHPVPINHMKLKRKTKREKKRAREWGKKGNGRSGRGGKEKEKVRERVDAGEMLKVKKKR